jgi:hypothetical protein
MPMEGQWFDETALQRRTAELSIRSLQIGAPTMTIVVGQRRLASQSCGRHVNCSTGLKQVSGAQTSVARSTGEATGERLIVRWVQSSVYGR